MQINIFRLCRVYSLGESVSRTEYVVGVSSIDEYHITEPYLHMLLFKHVVGEHDIHHNGYH